ncbi:TonB-dependent receptor [Aquimarina sp. TRL1]|uniref:TonB-dependent receptor n=1 Tax=Aquimarina sp. (strain TRL1) TaxID=2736252 RepID=UPI00158B4550|nr:TonB-dependent receptor [Aquimarina sp. TRL1]QKX03871.1 TonB-dependent receptor [Aquimarina sp. TRL1]
MKLKKAVIGIFLLVTIPMFSQSINGVVTATDGTPIPNAHIDILNSDQGTITNTKGVFVLPLREKLFRIVISKLGYTTRTMTIIPDQISQGVEVVLEKTTTSLEEIVITAQKREQTIIETPLAVSSLSGKKVNEMRAWDFTTLNGVVPNYTYHELGVGFQQVQVIRGVQVFSENPAVATYIDGVNSIDILANGVQLSEIERIEVLRGPQGTLFGRNAMGGVVNVLTKKPTNKTSGFAEVNLGNRNTQRYVVGIKTPIIKNTLFLGVDGMYTSKHGFLRNDTSQTLLQNTAIDGHRVGDEESFYTNLFLKWLPGTKFSATFNIKQQMDISDASAFFTTVSDEKIALANPDKIYLNRIGEHKRNLVNTSLALKFYGSDFTVSSISAYQRVGLEFKDIESGGFYASFDGKKIGAPLDPQQVFSQEIRIDSKENGSPIQYTMGVYGFTQQAFSPASNFATEDPVNLPGGYIIMKNEQDNFGIAAFGQASYSMTEKIKMTGGIRYDFEKRKSAYNTLGDLLFVGETIIENNPLVKKEGEFSAISPKVALSYIPGKEMTLYASYTKGFRAGGINGLNVPEIDKETYDPEYSDNYEVGYKARLVNKKIYVSATSFLINWKDLQFSNLVAPLTFAIENVGDARSMGIELEASAIPVKGWQLDVSLGYNDTEYQDFLLRRIDPVTFVEIEEQLEGNRLSNAPKTTLFIASQYTFPINRKNLTLRGEFRNIGTYYTDIQNTLEQENYSLFNARLSYESNELDIAVWGQNLFDKRYIAYGTPDTSFGRSTNMAAPGSIGITCRYKF